VLTVPRERPLLLEAVEHVQVSVIELVSRADGQFYAMDHHGQSGTRSLRRRQAVRDDFDLSTGSSWSLPAERLRRDFDKSY